MLTKNLLEVERSSGEIRPRYRHPDSEENRETARKVLEAYEPGRTKGEIWDELSSLETHDNFKFVRGLSKIVERQSDFVSAPPSEPEMSPRAIRKRLWKKGYVTTEEERNRRVAELARDTGLTTREVRESFWGDREENEELVESVDATPAELVKKYNLSLTQTLLFDALSLDFRLGGDADYQRVFGAVKRLGLMYDVDEDLKVTVTGPAALFKSTRKYGNALAKLLPVLVESEEWVVYAEVKHDAYGSDENVYDFELSSHTDDTGYLPDYAADNSLVETEYDSEVERSFASRVEKFAEGWEVTREPTILRVEHGLSEENGEGGVSVMIPDFGFERRGREFYLEIVGFWTPDYLADKIEKVRNVETDPDVSLVLAVNENLRATEEEFGDVDEVFFYDRQVPVKPVVERLRRIEDELRERDLGELEKGGLETPEETDGIVRISRIAESEGYGPAAVSEYLSRSEKHAGVVYKDRYVPESVVGEIEEKIRAIDEPSLPKVRGVLDDYGLGEGFLENVGYEIRWNSFADEDAEVVRK